MLVFSDSDKAEEFADSLEQACCPIKDDSTLVSVIVDTEHRVDDYLASAVISPFMFDELQKLLGNLKRKFASGDNTALRHLPKKEKVQILSTFNQFMYPTRSFPLVLLSSF